MISKIILVIVVFLSEKSLYNLQLICEEAGVKDVDHVIKTLQDQRKIAEIQPQLEQVKRSSKCQNNSWI